jgi:hypothetical protein
MEKEEAFMRTREIALAFAILGGVAAGCGSSSNTGTDGGGGTKGSGQADTGTKDVTVVDTGEDSMPEDSAPPGDGGKVACSGVKATDCEKCCIKAHPAGHHELVTAELACACEKPSLCGPLEGGKGIDSGALDEGACKDSCGTSNPPDGHCLLCLDKATGTKKKPGDCYTDVDTACTKDPDCVTYKKCLAGCGG